MEISAITAVDGATLAAAEAQVFTEEKAQKGTEAHPAEVEAAARAAPST
ncbi:hypothetical protein CATRI_04295 [Corynebacterium atrinae]|nr:hypothetical protein [Corynebacterium atrinae]WJY62955.1 hypothetical protein CATRI_04295 [Corynebacterium atrinae]